MTSSSLELMEKKMPADAIWFVALALGAFGAFGLALGYVNFIASDKAITAEQERNGK